MMKIQQRLYYRELNTLKRKMHQYWMDKEMIRIRIRMRMTTNFMNSIMIRIADTIQLIIHPENNQLHLLKHLLSSHNSHNLE